MDDDYVERIGLWCQNQEIEEKIEVECLASKKRTIADGPLRGYSHEIMNTQVCVL